MNTSQSLNDVYLYLEKHYLSVQSIAQMLPKNSYQKERKEIFDELQTLNENIGILKKVIREVKQMENLLVDD